MFRVIKKKMIKSLAFFFYYYFKIRFYIIIPTELFSNSFAHFMLEFPFFPTLIVLINTTVL